MTQLGNNTGSIQSTKTDYKNVNKDTLEEKITETINKYASVIQIITQCPHCFESYKKSLAAKKYDRMPDV